MPGILITWAISQGLSEFEAAIRTPAGEQRFETAVREQLNRIETKLDILIDAPFRQALMYLREGNVERCKDKLIEAMAHKELDLPATALYCSLLPNQRLALEYYEDILRKFGPHRAIVPTVLLAWLDQSLAGDTPLVESTGFRTTDDGRSKPPSNPEDYYPTDVYCSLWNIVVKWEHKEPRGRLERFLHILQPRLVAYDWTGTQLMSIERSEISILGLTGGYVVLDTAREAVEVFSLSRGVQLPDRLSKQQAESLFISDPAITAHTVFHGATSPPFAFGNAIVRVNDFDYAATETHHMGQYDLRGHDVIVTHTKGELVVERQQRDIDTRRSPLLHE